MELALTLNGWSNAISLLERKLYTETLLRSIGEGMVNSIHRRFDREETPSGEKWKKSWRAVEDGKKTLHDTGAFRKSWNYQLEGDTLVVGSEFPWANTHHFGAKIKAKNAPYLHFGVNGKYRQVKEVTIPARPVLGISDDDVTRIEWIFNDWIKKSGLNL